MKEFLIDLIGWIIVFVIGFAIVKSFGGPTWAAVIGGWTLVSAQK